MYMQLKYYQTVYFIKSCQFGIFYKIYWFSWFISKIPIGNAACIQDLSEVQEMGIKKSTCSTYYQTVLSKVANLAFSIRQIGFVTNK